MTRQATKKKGLRGGAIIWLDQNLKGKTYTQRFNDAGNLLNLAATARGALEANLPKISSKRKDVKFTYNQYRTAVLEIAADISDAVNQMKRLRPKFAKSPHKAQLKEYDAQMAKLEERLADMKHYAKWLPHELKRHEFKRVDDVLNTEVASLSPRTRPVKTKRAVPRGHRQTIEEMELRVAAAAASPEKGKAVKLTPREAFKNARRIRISRLTDRELNRKIRLAVKRKEEAKTAGDVKAANRQRLELSLLKQEKESRRA